MDLGLAIHYRGSLASCNYGCWYCPFAKQVDSKEELDQDRAALARFVQWVEAAPYPVSILFTPWGEALVRKYYRDAMIALSHMPHVRRVAAQTNLAYRLDWLDAANRKTLALWCTFHPSETTLERFAARCAKLSDMGIRYSVGCVGLREQIDEIEALRGKLPEDVYLWVNAFKREADYYDADSVERLEAVDPLFRLNRDYTSLGRDCAMGETAISVRHDGTVQRCHFIPEPLGNIYEGDIYARLFPKPCTAAKCGCHIGFVHLKDLGLHDVFEGGVLERIPAVGLWQEHNDRETARERVDGILQRERPRSE